MKCLLNLSFDSGVLLGNQFVVVELEVRVRVHVISIMIYLSLYYLSSIVREMPVSACFALFGMRVVLSLPQRASCVMRHHTGWEFCILFDIGESVLDETTR